MAAYCSRSVRKKAKLHGIDGTEKGCKATMRPFMGTVQAKTKRGDGCCCSPLVTAVRNWRISRRRDFATNTSCNKGARVSKYKHVLAM
jgi:hypothetical protein